MKTTAILNKFFNDGSYGRPKVTLGEFSREQLKELTQDEKEQLADEAAPILAPILGVPHERRDS